MAKYLISLFSLLQLFTEALSQNGDNPILGYTVSEELPNAFIGSISLSDHLTNTYDTDTINSFRYKFLPQPNQDASIFTIDKVTGEIRTSLPLDREVHCPGMEKCYLYVDVAVVEPRDFFQVMTAKIEVLDINDYIPTFPKNQVDLVFSESSAIGTSKPLTPAVDLDSPIYGIKRYVFTPESSEFGLISPGFNTGNAAGNLKIYVKAKLDRERKDVYKFKVHAYDGGTPSLSTTLDITITVEDANDNPPQFTQSTYEVSIKEDWDLNKAFLQISASDIDEDINGKVTYSLSTSTESVYGRTFGVDPEKGDIYLRTALDFETRKSYDLVVIAQDGGMDSNVVEAKVTIHVTDVNDYAPKVTVNTLLADNEAIISESDPPGTFVAYVSVFDADSGQNKETICTLTDPSFGLQALSGSSQYKVITLQSFDRERRDSYTLIIQCSDKGESPLKGIQNFTVKISDVNDNPPIFEQSDYIVTVLENNKVGDTLLTVQAIDDDINENSDLRYSMTDGALSQFVQINAITGDIIAKVPLDYEMVKSLNFEVIVKDSGDPVLQGNTMVIINIKDVNDEAPAFNRQVYSFNVYENEANVIPVGEVKATDQDSEPFNEVEYSLQQSDDSTRFSINPETGLITTIRSMDRELKSQYSFYAIASDKKDPSLKTATSVIVKIKDRNDNAPRIMFPSKDNNTAKISNAVPSGFVVCYVSANDSDRLENAKLTYTVYDDVNNNVKSLFVVDSATGAVMTTADLRPFDGTSFRLSVVVRDNGIPAKTSTDYLTIKIDSNVPYDGASEELVEGGNLTTIIAVSTVSSIIVVGLALVIIFIKFKDTRETAKAKALMPHFTVEKQDNNNKRYDGIDSVAQIYTVENDHEQHQNNKSVFQISAKQTNSHYKPDINSSICTISSDHSLLYDKRLEGKSTDLKHPNDEELESNNSSTDLSNTDSGRGLSVDEELNNSKREYHQGSNDVPDLLQRKDHIQLSSNQKSCPVTPPRNHPQQPPPSYESFLRRKSQGSSRTKSQKHIHFADDLQQEQDNNMYMNSPRNISKQQHILNLQHQTKMQYYNKDNNSNRNSSESHSSNSNSERHTGQNKDQEPLSVQVLQNTYSSVMV